MSLVRLTRPRALLVPLLAVCATGAPGCASTSARPAAGGPPAAAARAPAPAPSPSPGKVPHAAARPPYLPDEALRDALAGPLQLVGVGGWPGSFRRLACVYRNQRVLVVDERCSDPREPPGLVVHVLSPARGRATVFAEAGAPIGRARRPEYQAFGVASTAPRTPPATLAPTMTYEEIVAYEAENGRATCSAGTQRPEGHCSKTAGSASEFAAAVEPFVRAPPEEWYDLVRELVQLRVRAHAAIRPASLPLPRLVAWGASWARDHDVTVDERNLEAVGNPHGRSAAIAVTRDGGVLIAGTTTQGGVTVPAVLRADAHGARRWTRALPEKGFVTHEVAGVAAVPGGAIVLSPGYPSPGWLPTARVIALDEEGKVRWQWLGRGKVRDARGRERTPQVVTAQPTDRGTVLLRGYIQPVADGDVHEWQGELDGRTGKALREETLAILPDHAASFE